MKEHLLDVIYVDLQLPPPHPPLQQEHIVAIARAWLKPEGHIMLPIKTYANINARSVHLEADRLLQQDNQFISLGKIELLNFEDQPILLVARFVAGRHVEQKIKYVKRPTVSYLPYAGRLNEP